MTAPRGTTDGAVSATRGPSRRTAALVLAVLAVGVLPSAWQNFRFPYLAHQADFGYCLQVSERILRGEVPYRDYLTIWTPGTHLLTALSFAVFRPSFWAAKLPLVLFIAAAVPLCYRWLRQHVNRSGALMGVTVFWAALPFTTDLPYSMFFTLAPAFLVFTALGRLRPDHLLWPAWWAGIGVGLALGLKHNIGILLGLGVWVRLLCITPYSALAPGPGAAWNRAFSPVVRLVGCAAAVGALLHLWRDFPGVWPLPVITLVPVALLTVAGAVRAWWCDRAATPPPRVLPLLSACVVAGGGMVLLNAPWVLWLAHHDALGPFLEQTMLVRPADAPDWGALYGLLLRPIPLSRASPFLALGCVATFAACRTRRPPLAWGWGGVALAALVVAVSWQGSAAGRELRTYGLAALFPAAWLWTRSAPSACRAVTAVTVAAWYAVLAYPGATPTHVTTAGIPLLALAVAGAWHVGGAGRGPGRVATIAVALVALLDVWQPWMNAVIQTTPDGLRFHALARVPGPRGGTWVQAGRADALPLAAGMIDALAPPGAPLVAWPALGMLNFYTGRPNPTHMDLYWPGLVTPQVEATLLAELEAAQAPVLVRETAEDLVFGDGLLWSHHPRLADWIATHYVLVGQVDTWDILLRIPPPPRNGPAARP